MKIFVVIYSAILALAAFSDAQAQNTTTKNPDLPNFQYRLTDKPEGERQQLCELNKGFCQTNCGGPAKAPMNFCNATTMGWGCGCSEKVPDLLGYEWPINRENCIGSGEACKTSCQGPDVPVENKTKCTQACIETYTQKCGTPQQPPAYYSVPNITTVPTYAPPEDPKSTAPTGNSSTNGNSSSNGSESNVNDNKKQSSASSLSYFGNAVVALVIVSGVSLL